MIDGEAVRVRILQLQVDLSSAERARLTGFDALRDPFALAIPDRFRGERHGSPSAVVDAFGDRRRRCRWPLCRTASSLILYLPVLFGCGLPLGFGFLHLPLSASLFDVAQDGHDGIAVHCCSPFWR